MPLGIKFSSLPLTSIANSSVPQHFPSIFWSSGHTPQCNGSDPLLKLKICLKFGGFSTMDHLHNVNTFQAVHARLVVNKQKPRLHNCQMELKNFAWKAQFQVPSILSLVILPSICEQRLEVTLSFWECY